MKCEYCGRIIIDRVPHRCLKSIISDEALEKQAEQKRMKYEVRSSQVRSKNEHRNDAIFQKLASTDKIRKCKVCGKDAAMVVDSRLRYGGAVIVRKRICDCGERWNSYEISEQNFLLLQRLYELEMKKTWFRL